jgi:hypothetical protein
MPVRCRRESTRHRHAGSHAVSEEIEKQILTKSIDYDEMSVGRGTRFPHRPSRAGARPDHTPARDFPHEGPRICNDADRQSGPGRRIAIVEMIAVADLRLQCATLAEHLLADTPTRRVA